MLSNIAFTSVLSSVAASAAYGYVSPAHYPHNERLPSQAFECRFIDEDNRSYFGESDLRVGSNFKPALDAAEARCLEISAKPESCKLVDCFTIASRPDYWPY